jgi:hypothetical protein
MCVLQGIVFSVRPPKKSWKHIANLSGGEKTLSSLSLVFALHHYKPTPLYVMDEIDAALDFKNVSIGGCALMTRLYFTATALLLDFQARTCSAPTNLPSCCALVMPWFQNPRCVDW